jgi:hypothetical protein
MQKLKVVYNQKQSAKQPLSKSFLEFFDNWVAEAKRENKKILFRCVCGCHRAGRLAAYYEIKYLGASFEKALINFYRYGRQMEKYDDLLTQILALADYGAGQPCRFSNNSLANRCVR